MGGSGDLGECVQAPIARRFAPNVCSALAPPGACSQASFDRKPRIHVRILIYQTWPIGHNNKIFSAHVCNLSITKLA